MEKQISKNSESGLAKLGLYQLIGGAIGVLFILLVIINNLQLTGVEVLIYLFTFLFFAYSIFCGILCLKKNKTALWHSLANQILQVFSFAIMGFAFKYVAGIYFIIELNLTDSFNLKFGSGLSNFDFNINMEKERLEVGINLIAIFLISWISKLIKQIKDEAAASQVSTIGEM